MKGSVTLLFFFSFLVFGQAQQIYYSTIQSAVGVDNIATIGIFDLTDCTSTELYVDTTSQFTGYIEWRDVALGADGNLYGLSNDGIYIIDIVNQKHTRLIGPPFTHPRDKGLACTKDSILIYGERNLYSYDLNSHVFMSYGQLPTSMAVWGDLFWLDGNLMCSANDKIIQIDLLDPPSSQVYCTLPKTGFLALIEGAISCDSIVDFAYYSHGDIYLFNPLDCSITNYCTIPHFKDQIFQGSSPVLMYMPPEPCKIHLDLDSGDITLPGIDYGDTVLCSLPNKYILSVPDLFSDKPWDSLWVWIEQGPSGVMLDGISPPFASLSGQNSNHLRFYATTLSDFNSLAPYLNELILMGDMPMGISTLKIGFRGWAKNLVSDTAYAFITLISRTTFAGEDSTINVCLSDSNLLLSTLLSSDATHGGIWTPSLLKYDEFNPKNDKPGKYQYVVDDPVCDADTADFLIETISQPIFDLGPNRFLCPGDTTRFIINLSNVDFLWSDGSSQSSIDIIEPQTLSINITDQFGCIYSDSTQVEFDENCIIQGVYIPNIFSPDGNGINDEWIIDGNAGIQEMEVSVFDRWGNMLFYQKGNSIHWNGNSKNNELLPSGVYVYMLKIFISSENKIIKTGSITLLR
ncbi:MAG: gliding motility-associated C-terminal domain-containing protein [Saprospiraceae bacterium]